MNEAAPKPVEMLDATPFRSGLLDVDEIASLQICSRLHRMREEYDECSTPDHVDFDLPPIRR